MSEKPARYIADTVRDKILMIRGQRVIMDRDLASLYDIPTFRFNEAIKRNHRRFPGDFAFQLTREEMRALISQIAISKPGRGGTRKLPWVFTEHGAVMAANALRSVRAIHMSVFIVRAFMMLRQHLAATADMEKRLADIETKLIAHDVSLRELYNKIKPLLLSPPEKPKRQIGFIAKEKKAGYQART